MICAHPAPFAMSTPRTESIVKKRYSAGAEARQAALCCPVSYDPRHLKIIPQEVIEKDYGCGDPSRHVRPGETVLDLGSGTGKICFIASQVVGAAGRVIGVDMTDAMLEVARRNAPVVAERIGWSNVEFRKGRIQDLALDLEALDRELAAHPASDANGFLRALEMAAELRVRQPLIADSSIDVVVSNCVLNLVDNRDRLQLFSEIFRVLKVGGRAVISDIVCDEDVPADLQKDPTLWSGCISGAFREDRFLQAFEDAGFHGVRLLNLDQAPWQTVNGIEFRSTTVEAFKGKHGPCLERNQAVIYRGPFKKVLDDDGHAMERGKRYAVCEKTFNLYRREPYTGMFDFIEPLQPVAPEDARTYDCRITRLRSPSETKGEGYHATSAAASDCCSPNGDKCC
jgi:SAM-dependent methyltransferase